MNTSEQNNNTPTANTSARQRHPGARQRHPGIRRSTFLKLGVLAALTAIVALGCPHPIGIFASLEEEIPVDEERGVPTGDTMRQMLATETGDDGGGYFYAAFTSLYVRERGEDRDLSADSPDTDWSQVSKPSGLSDEEVLTSIAQHEVNGDNRIYAVYAGGNSGSLFYRDAGVGTSSGDWNRISVGDITENGADKVSKVFSAGDELIVSVRVEQRSGEGDIYAVYRRDSGDTEWGEVATPDDENEVGFVYDFAYFDDGNGNGDYYLATFRNILRSDNGLETTSADFKKEVHSGSGPYRDLLVADIEGTDTLFAAAREAIFSTDSTPDATGDWTEAEISGDDDVQFSAIGYYPGSEFREDIGAFLIAGTRSNGLYEAEADNGGNFVFREEGANRVLLGRDGNFLTTRLSGRGVRSIFVDEDAGTWRSEGPHIFVGAATAGLWRGEVDEDDDPDNEFLWRRE